MHKRVIVLAVCLVMIFSSYVFAASDTDGFWAEAVLNEWESEGLLSGDGSGDLRPNDSITRAEFIALINRWKGFNGSTNKIADYSDVSEKAWYYDDIVAALAAGYIEGFPDGTIRPNDPITREEAMVIVARLNDLTDGPDVSILAKASDGEDVSVWAQGLVAAVVSEGLISGFDGRLTPKANITRAETVVLLDRVRDDVRIFGFEGVYGPITGIRTVSEVIIAASGITLQNMVINDGLAVSAAAGEGFAAFNNVTVDGSIAVLGGADAITLFNSRATDINISKAGIRLVLNGDTVVRSIVSEGIGGVVEVKDTAKLESLTIAAADNTVIVGGTASVESVNTNAGGARIEISEDASIGIVTMNASTTVIGSGSIAAANVKANGCVMEKSPGKLNVDDGISFSVDDRGAADAQSGGGFVNSGIGGGGGIGTGGGGGGASANPVFKSDNIADKKVSYGTSFENLALPSEVTLVGSDNAEVIADIDWSTAKSVYDAAVSGVYTLSGILSNRRVLEGSVPGWAIAKTTVDISVTVLDGKTYLIPKVAVKVPFDIIDAEAMLDALPLSVVAVLSDGSNFSVNIDWEYAGEDAIPSQISPGVYEYVGTVSGLPPDTPAVPLHGAVEVLSEENSAIQVASVVFDIAAANIVIPDINPVRKTFSVVFADQYGVVRSADAFEPEAAVAWSITDSEGEPLTGAVLANITVTDGVVAVAKDASAGEYIVTATVIGSDPVICAEAIVYVVEQNPVVSSLVISGPKAVVLDTDHLTDMTYSVLVLDEHGVEIFSDIAPVLTLKEEITGVSLASDTITISSLTEGFVPGSFVLTAIYNNGTVENDEDDIQADDFVVSFDYAAPVVAFVEIGGINGEDLVLPAIGGNAAFKQFSAVVRDQYARSAEGEVAWELSDEYAGVTLADGLLTVTDAAEAGTTVSFFAKVGEVKSLVRTVDIIKGTPVFTSVEDQGEDAVILPGNTPSAGLSVMRDFKPLDQYGDVFDGLIDWIAEYKDSVPDIDASAVSINGNGTLSVTALAIPGVVVVSAVFDAETDIVKTVEVSIAKAEGAALVPSGIVFEATDGSDIAIPFGETPVCRVLSPSFVDQYGDSIENDTEITVSVLTNPVPAGVSFNAESHTFTVAKAAALMAANFPENQSGFVVEFKAEAALPDTVGSVISGALNIKVVKDSTMTDIAIKSEGDEDTLAVPTLAKRSSSLRFNVVGTDAYGNEGSEAQGVEWSIADDTDEDGLSIDTEGVLVIDNTALAGTITIRAVAGNTEDDFDLELTRESSILTKVEIAGQDGTQPAATVPTTGDDHIFYYAALKDQYDSAFSAGGVVKYEWSLAEPIGGVSFITDNANPGVLDTNGAADFVKFDLTVTVTVGSGSPIKSDVLYVMALNPFSVSGLKWTNIPPSPSADMCFFGVFDKLEGDALIAAKAAVGAKEDADGKTPGDYALGFIPQFYDADTDEEVLPPWSILQETFIAVDQLALEEGEYYFEIKTAIVNKAGELVQILASSISSPPISVVDDGSGIEISAVLNAEDNHSVDLVFDGDPLTGRYVVNAFMMDKGFSGYSAVMTSSSQVTVPLYGVATQLRFALIKSIVINDDGSGKVEMAAHDVTVANAPEYVGNVLLSSEETAADINWVTIFNENIYPNGMYMFLDIDVNAEGEVIEKAPPSLSPEADKWYIHTADTDDYQVTYGDYDRDEKVLVWIKNPTADGFAALTINGSEYRFVQSAEGIITLVSPAQDVGINGEVSIEVVHALAPNGNTIIPSVADITGSYTIESHDAVDLTEGQATFDGRHIILTSDLIAEIGKDLPLGGRTVVDFNFIMTVSGEPSGIFSGTVEVGFSKSVRKVIDLSEVDTSSLYDLPTDWVALFNSSLYPSGVEFVIILPSDDTVSTQAPGDNPDWGTWYISEAAEDGYTVEYLDGQVDNPNTVMVTISDTLIEISFEILSVGGVYPFVAVGSGSNYMRLIDVSDVLTPIDAPVGVVVNSFWGADGEWDTVELQGGEDVTATVSVNGCTPIAVEESIAIDEEYGVFLIPIATFEAYTSVLENDESATFDFSITVLVDGSPYTGTCRVTVTHMEWS